MLNTAKLVGKCFAVGVGCCLFSKIADQCCLYAKGKMRREPFLVPETEQFSTKKQNKADTAYSVNPETRPTKTK